MKAIEARTQSDFEALAAKYQTSGFALSLEKAYGRFIRATMQHQGHKIITVIEACHLGMGVMAMRRELNKGNFCPTCGAVK
jgi:hypothetical protein